MLRFTVRRLVFLVFVILGISVFMFTIMYLLPVDPARAVAGRLAGPE